MLGMLMTALLIPAWALAAVRVTPGEAHLQAGATCAFGATLDGGQPAGGWRWRVLAGQGEIDEASGRYRAPAGAGAARVRAELRSDPAVAGEASVLVLPLPAELGGVVGAYLGGPPHSDRLPFLDPETGRRPENADGAFSGPAIRLQGHRVLAGFGLPFLPFGLPAGRGEAQRLTYREGNAWVRVDAGDEGWMGAAPRGRVEALSMEFLHWKPHLWRSAIQEHAVDVRGVLPFCGHALAGGHQDGQGVSARFQEPFGLACLAPGAGAGRAWPLLLVSDRAGHVLRTVTAQGEVSTLCGQPGQAGHRDSPGMLERLRALCPGGASQPPLFNGPTHLAVRRAPGANRFCAAREEALVADSGNHVIRSVSADGKVATLAGTPGRAGHRDSAFAELAVFNDPQGLAAHAEGTVYVADRGNRVIRAIHPDGAVTTLAGAPGEAGAVDSADGPARFTDPKALCLHPRLAALCVLDGHALRLVHLPEGTVGTLLGVADAPGFRDIGPGEPGDQACLNDPTGLAWTGEGLLIADHGNHAVRMVSPDGRQLRTVAGDPAQGFTRWGLVRDGLTGPPDERYAALEGPWTVASRPGDAGAFATSGPSLAEIRHALEGRALISIQIREQAAEVPVRAPHAVRVSLESEGVDILHCTADYLDPDGQCCARSRGVATRVQPAEMTGSFTRAGRARVVVRGVTGQGVSTEREVEVQVNP